MSEGEFKKRIQYALETSEVTVVTTFNIGRGTKLSFNIRKVADVLDEAKKEFDGALTMAEVVEWSYKWFGDEK